MEMSNFLLLLKTGERLFKELKDKAKERGQGNTEAEFPFGLLEMQTEEGSRSSKDYQGAFELAAIRIQDANKALEAAGSDVRVSIPEVASNSTVTMTTTFPVVVMTDELETAMAPVVEALACALACAGLDAGKLNKLGLPADVVARAVAEAHPVELKVKA